MLIIKLTGGGGSELYRMWKTEHLIATRLSAQFVDISDPLHPKVVAVVGHNAAPMSVSKEKHITPKDGRLAKLDIAKRHLLGDPKATLTLRLMDSSEAEKLIQEAKLDLYKTKIDRIQSTEAPEVDYLEFTKLPSSEEIRTRVAKAIMGHEGRLIGIKMSGMFIDEPEKIKCDL